MSSGSLDSQFPGVLGALFETFFHVWWFCTYLNYLLRKTVLRPATVSFFLVPLGVCFWSAVSLEVLLLLGMEKVGCPPVATWGAEALYRNRLGSFLFAIPGPQSCWLWREGLAWQLSLTSSFPSTHALYLASMAQSSGLISALYQW